MTNKEQAKELLKNTYFGDITSFKSNFESFVKGRIVDKVIGFKNELKQKIAEDVAVANGTPTTTPTATPQATPAPAPEIDPDVLKKLTDAGLVPANATPDQIKAALATLQPKA